MNIQPINASEFALWDEFVERSAQGTLFHSEVWSKGSMVPLHRYGVFDGGKLIGGFVLGGGNNGALKSSARQPPFTPYLGLMTLTSSDKRVAKISREKEIAALIAEHVKKDFDSIEVRFSPEVSDLQPFIWAGYEVNVRYTYLVDVSDLDETWGEMDAKRRNDIRKAEKTGLAVKRGVEIDTAIDVIKATLQRQGTWSDKHPSIIRRYDEALGNKRRREIFGVIDAGGELVAVAYIAWDHRRSYYLMGGYKDESSRGAPALALWEAMKFTRNDLALGQFDLEGSMIPGVEKFFRQFGGQLVPTFTARWARPHWNPYSMLRSGLSYAKRRYLESATNGVR